MQMNYNRNAVASRASKPMERNKKQTEKEFSAQTKSKARVRDHGEVFTAEREVKAMCDLVKDETENIFSRFLEPACGNGNFLAEILARKLLSVKSKYKKSSYDYERFSLLTLASLYGVDILADNAAECRERLYGIWNSEYACACKSEANEDTRKSARFILQRNIVCGNALSLMCVDENGDDTDEPIVFSEWSFPFNDAQMQRKDYSFAELLHTAEYNEKNKEEGQPSLFANENGEDEATFLKQYISHYRRIWQNG